MSADGSFVAGISYATFSMPRAFRWSRPGAMQDLGLLPGWEQATAMGISGDGAVVVGYCGPSSTPNNQAAFRWSEAGMTQLASVPSAAAAVSQDGSTIVGSASGQACRWTALGLEPLGAVGTALAVSADGSVVVGSTDGIAFRWTAQSGIQLLGTLPGHAFSRATVVSPDGETVLGESGYVVSGHVFGTAFRWTAAQGMQTLGEPPHARAIPKSMNPAGSMVVGSWVFDLSIYHPLLWTAEHQGVNLNSLLPPLGLASTEWRLTEAVAVSDDGGSIAGYGTHYGSGQLESAFVLSGLPPLTCYANCTGRTTAPILNVSQFACFLQAFARSAQYTPPWVIYDYANCDRSTSFPALNAADFTCFLQRYAAGCP